MGTLSWNPATKALAVSGILYLDGNLVMSGGNANYTGTGTIFVNGRVAISGNMTVCGPGAAVSGSTCTGTWNAALGALAVVAVNSGGVSGLTGPGRAPPRLPGACRGTPRSTSSPTSSAAIQQTGTSYVTGPVTTDQGVISGTPNPHRRPEPAPGDARRRGIDGSSLVGARRTQQLAPDAGGLSGTSARISRCRW